jgi:hypothetical protein
MRTRAIISFIVVFAFAFFLGGWFLMPHLPPVPDHLVSVFEFDGFRFAPPVATLRSPLSGLQPACGVFAGCIMSKYCYIKIWRIFLFRHDLRRIELEGKTPMVRYGAKWASGACKSRGR